MDYSGRAFLRPKTGISTDAVAPGRVLLICEAQQGVVMHDHFWRGRWQGRTPAGDAHQRAREIVRPTGGIVRGKFPSRKNGRLVHHEGLLELDAIYVFESSHRIVRYREQPTTLQYPDGARLRRYTPDFELVLDTGEVVLVEVKPTRSLRDPEVRHKLCCVIEHFRRSGQSFVILDDICIRDEPRLSGLRWIYHQAARIPPTREAARTALLRHGSGFPMSLRTATARLSTSKVDPYSLLLSGWLWCSLETAVSLDTFVHLANEDDHAWFWIAKEHGF